MTSKEVAVRKPRSRPGRRHTGQGYRRPGHRQKRMKRCDHLRALTYCRRHALDGPGADVSNGECARPARPQRCAANAVVLTGQHEPLGIDRDTRSRQPPGVGVGTDKKEQMMDRPPYVRRRRALAPMDRFEPAIATFKA